MKSLMPRLQVQVVLAVVALTTLVAFLLFLISPTVAAVIQFSVIIATIANGFRA